MPDASTDAQAHNAADSPTNTATIDALLQENRVFTPPPQFAANAVVRDPGVYERAEADPEAFWAEAARRLDWDKPWDTVLEWNAPWAKWFVGGKLNASYNCVDRHVKTWRRNKAAIIWEGEPGDMRVLTYRDLQREVNRCAKMLQHLGVQKGDRVAIYMRMIPELAIAMLACARIGAPHTVVFGGFQRRGAARPHQRRAGQACHHRGRRLAARQRGPAQAHDGCRRR